MNCKEITSERTYSFDNTPIKVSNETEDGRWKLTFVNGAGINETQLEKCIEILIDLNKEVRTR